MCHTQVSAAEAESRIKAINEPYKLEILNSIVERTPDAPITIYHIGDQEHPSHWWDLCAGPHVDSTGSIHVDAFDLESVAGAYWRGDENNAMLQVSALCCLRGDPVVVLGKVAVTATDPLDVDRSNTTHQLLTAQACNG